MSEGGKGTPVERRQASLALDPSASDTPATPAATPFASALGAAPAAAAKTRSFYDIAAEAASLVEAPPPPPSQGSNNPRYQQLKASGPKLRSRAARKHARAKDVGRLLAEGERINSREAFKNEIVYVPTFLVNAPLPIRPTPDDQRLWMTRYPSARGEITAAYEAGTILGPDGREISAGLPYGVYPRIILSWLFTRVVTLKQPVIHIVDPNPLARDVAHTFTDWMRDDLGLTPTGGPKGTIRQLREQMTRLFNLKISTILNRKDSTIRVLPIAGDSGFFDPAHLRGERAEGPLTLTIDRLLFVEVLKSSSPSHLAVQRHLAAMHAPLALDLYRFLCIRQYHLEKSLAKVPEIVTWAQAYEQFGKGHAHIRNFRAAVIEALELIQCLYPGCKAEACPGGIRIRPSRPHVRILDKSPRTIAAAAAASREP